MSVFFAFFILVASSAWGDPAAKEGLAKSEMRYLVDSVDDVIGGSRADDNRSYSTLRVKSNWENRHSQVPGPPRIHANLALKLGKLTDWQNDIQEWFQSHLDRVTELWKKTEGQTTNKAIEEKKVEPPQVDPWRFTFEPHAAWSLPEPLFSFTARVRKDFQYPLVLHSFSPTVGWSTRQRWETAISLTSSSQLATHFMGSFLNSVNWAWNEKTFSAAQGPSFSYLLSSHQVLSLGATVGSSIEHKVLFAQSYNISAGYRLTAFHDKVFIFVNPFLDYQKSRHFGSDPGIAFSVEIVL